LLDSAKRGAQTPQRSKMAETLAPSSITVTGIVHLIMIVM
jgi:hypothetical protein